MNIAEAIMNIAKEKFEKGDISMELCIEMDFEKLRKILKNEEELIYARHTGGEGVDWSLTVAPKCPEGYEIIAEEYIGGNPWCNSTEKRLFKKKGSTLEIDEYFVEKLQSELEEVQKFIKEKNKEISLTKRWSTKKKEDIFFKSSNYKLCFYYYRETGVSAYIKSENFKISI